MTRVLFVDSSGGITDREGNPAREVLVRTGRLEMPHQTWGPAGAAMMEEACRAWRDRASAGERILVRPHHADVMSDIQRCLAFSRSERGGLLLAMDPVGLLAPSMLPGAEDHLRRIVEATHACPSLGAIVLTNAEMVSSDEEERTRPVAIDRGMVPERLMREMSISLAAVAESRELPLILTRERAGRQTALLEAWGVLCPDDLSRV